MKIYIPGVGFLCFFFSSCSPLRSSPHDEKHQLELTLHEVQTNLDDLRHDINCFQTEIQILEGRIKYFENSILALKQNDQEKMKIEQLFQSVQSLEKKWALVQKSQSSEEKELQDLRGFANEVTAALSQFKARIEELEGEILSQNRKFDELGPVKAVGKAKIHKVKTGDSLEKLARTYKTAVEKIKKYNGLEQDLIVVGQELKIPEA